MYELPRARTQALCSRLRDLAWSVLFRCVYGGEGGGVVRGALELAVLVVGYLHTTGGLLVQWCVSVAPIATSPSQGPGAVQGGGAVSLWGGWEGLSIVVTGESMGESVVRHGHAVRTHVAAPNPGSFPGLYAPGRRRRLRASAEGLGRRGELEYHII